MKSLFLLLLVSLPGIDVTALEGGPHAVGFKALYQYDYTRSYTPKFDYENKPVPEEIARPMPIYVWYPAKNSSPRRTMLFQDYVFLRAVEDEFGPLNEDRKSFAQSWYQSYSGAPGVSKDVIGALLASKTKAVRDAREQAGKFPLIIYAPGYSEGGHENTVMAEYLASHGYVVAMTPMRGMFARTGDDYLTSIEAQTRDLGFVLAAMRSNPHVEARRLGLVGFDEGGLAAALLALHNYGVDAVVSLSGSLGYRTEEISRRFPYVSGARLRAAYLEVLGGAKKFNRDPASYKPAFYDGIRYADAYSLRFKTLAHDEFTSDHLMNYVDTGHDGGPASAKEIQLGYTATCNYIRHFLNAYVKGEKRGLSVLQGRTEEHGLPAGVIEKWSKAGLPLPPTARQFVALIKERGIAKGIQTYSGKQGSTTSGIDCSEAVASRTRSRFSN